MNKENTEANEPNAKNSTSLAGQRLAKLESINADLLNLLTAAGRLDELTGENLSVYARTFAALARSAIAKATGGALNPDLSPQ